MKLTVLQPTFKTALDKASMAVETRPAWPVMSNVKLDARDGELRVTGANLSEGYSITAIVGAKVEVEGSTTQPAKHLKEYVGRLDADRIDITLDPITDTTNYRCGGSKSNIKGITADEFAPLTDPKGETFEMDAAKFKELIKSVSFSTATDDHRPALTGVYFRLTGSEVLAAAADGYRLMVDTASIIGDLKREFLLPDRAVEAAAKLVEKDDDTLLFVVGEDSLGIQGNTWQVVVQYLDAKYPDFEGIIPRDFATTVNVNRKTLLEAIRAALVFSRDSANSVTLTVNVNNHGDAKLTVRGFSPERGDIETDVDAERCDSFSGTVSVSVNGKYMQQFVAQADRGDTLAIHIKNTKTPVMFTLPGKEHPLYIIMPMAAADEVGRYMPKAA